MQLRIAKMFIVSGLTAFCGFTIYSSTGIVGVTKKDRPTAFFHGCICHGDSATNVRVWVSGPDSVGAGQQALYRISVAKDSNIAAGFNVATYRGDLGLADSTGTHLARPAAADSLELTHSFPKLHAGSDTISWLFYYKAPLTVGFFDTIYSCGNSVDLSQDPSGDFWRFGLNFRVKVTNPLSVDEDPLVAHSIGVLQNYPNPFNPTTRIRFTLQHSGHATLKVFDLAGREMAALVDEELVPGSHEVTWNASGFASGIYFCRLQAGGLVETKKLVLMK